jgi:centrosomal protein CEP76
LETPRHAARFVSLIGYEEQQSIGESNGLDVWRDFHTFLSASKGDIQDHALLLCSLLLGFHLDAYITIGFDTNNNSHMWITTIDLQGKSYTFISGAVTFIEPLSGVYYGQLEKHHFKTVGCLFNATKFYANIQVVDVADRIKFKLDDPIQWKCLQPPAHNTPNNSSFTLLPPSLNPLIIEVEVEHVLKQLIQYFRRDHRLTCVWDDTLSNLCGQSLWNMEYSKLAGQRQLTSLFSEDFQIGVKQLIPQGHTFRGYPISFNHTHPQRIMQSLIKSKQCIEILRSRGDMVRMSIRVKVFSYCEGIQSCWVMIGSRALF